MLAVNLTGVSEVLEAIPDLLSHLLCRGFAKRTLMKIPKKAGIHVKSKDSRSKQKYVLPTPPLTRRVLETQSERPHSMSFDDELSSK